jgi:hypothetical protein
MSLLTPPRFYRFPGVVRLPSPTVCSSDAMPSSIQPGLVPSSSSSLAPQPRLLHPSLFLLHQPLDKRLEVEVGRGKVLGHCGGLSQHAPVDDRWENSPSDAAGLLEAGCFVLA